ncbi:hypothetical protein COCC4DRAFT_174510 [Bipolaris maydis ATCC 48331]|uniref:Subtelomeric hrmA-associated cluster protein AFUB-079030/YDR124W-like helical bundle domain-containing protein n=2 Tax=Cochliobolus heterostrophus TaxID=5016 RepID=M2UVZ2_COCH5|nr:uncharacterized protein COCC4DRAFT_174510 [Bipolaris maydis ATCC 48331]EMD92013.1 hypothetical protein COCHEDRAFT_1223960 [Bipolaris maydis C5]KAJ5021379.1 hypothetical protein J3E73DRAFT_241253 [Bipolaris maydis]ENI02504.1 hypothetical protein COCC4DRAFT_174510 [Bipolaris maydis ATCC 48331]KAJ5061348.1 hypothetical protein J3E74DRAFT_418147 [Bipolaris maydis]KAJ6210620.1 hypothetical protein PSV09DRAFT_1223960 [Bipolaris maydis]
MRATVSMPPYENSSRLPEAPQPTKQDESRTDVAIPIPIAQTCWKITSPDGHEQLCYEPIPGFEHLWSGSGSSQKSNTCFNASPKATSLQLSQPTVTQGLGRKSSKPRTQQDPRKRTRSGRRKLRSQPVAQSTSDKEDGQLGEDIKIKTEQSYTFYIGDIDELKKFFRRRLDELTMKPLRPIVTAWIKQIEPKRLSRYGRYHKQLPKDQPEECSPPWWPRDVSYEEPSHLDKAGLLTLAVDIMLQHRLIDKEKRKGSWVAKLRQAAQYAVETTPPEQFSSSKGSNFSEKMQNRALAEILPNLFETAQLYEDHFAWHRHYEGSGIPDPGKGKRVTWQPLTRPARQPATPRKRPRTTKEGAAPRSETDVEASGNETEIDDCATSFYLCGQEPASDQPEGSDIFGPKETAQQTPVSACGGTAAPLHTCPCSTTTAPNVSFGQPMHGLTLGEEMDLDVGMAACTPLHDHTHINGGHQIQYSDGDSGFNQYLVQLQQDGCPPFRGSQSQSGFTSSSTPLYHHPFPAFDAHFSHSVEHVAFHDDTCYPHGYKMYMSSPANSLHLFGDTSIDAGMACPVEAPRY